MREDFIKEVWKIEVQQRKTDEAHKRFLRLIDAFTQEDEVLIKCNSQVISELIETLFRGEFTLVKEESFHPNNVLLTKRVNIGQNTDVVFHLFIDEESVLYSVC